MKHCVSPKHCIFPEIYWVSQEKRDVFANEVDFVNSYLQNSLHVKKFNVDTKTFGQNRSFRSFRSRNDFDYIYLNGRLNF